MSDTAYWIIGLAGALLGGGGGTHLVQRYRNGAASESPGITPAECNERHEEIRTDMRASREEIRDSIHELTTEVRVGFETIRLDVAKVAREERNGHETRYHPEG